MAFKHSRVKNQGGMGLIILAVLGLFIAASAFLTLFITSQKAKTPYRYQNLHIPAPTIPGQQTLPPLTQPLKLEITTQPSPEAEAEIPQDSQPQSTISGQTSETETSPFDEDAQ